MPSGRPAASLLFPALLSAFALAASAPAPARAQGPRRVVLGAGGDILMHTRVLATGEAHGYARVFEGLRAVIGEDEIAFANLETPLSMERDPRRGDPPILGAPPELAGVLAELGLDVLSAANNHAWDQGASGQRSSLEAVRAAGMVSVGAAEEEEQAAGPVVIERGGLRVAFVAFTRMVQGRSGAHPGVHIAVYERGLARRALRRAREVADVVVVSMHWGREYRHGTRREQRETTEQLIRDGADVILGHGPHVLQPVARLPSPRGEALVAYSLGNLVSNQGYLYRRGEPPPAGGDRPLILPGTRDGIWLRAALEVDGGRIRIAELEGIPLWTRNNYHAMREGPRAERPAYDEVRAGILSASADEALVAERRAAVAAALGAEVPLADGPTVAADALPPLPAEPPPTLPEAYAARGLAAPLPLEPEQSAPPTQEL